MKTLFQPTIEGNPLYKKVYDADFSAAQDDKGLKKAFGAQLSELTDLMGGILDPITSLTQVAEVFHYAVLSANLLQHKADYRYNEILAAAPKEFSTQTMILSQFESDEDDDNENDFSEFRSSVSFAVKNLTEQMGKPFKYSGTLMRALTMVAAMSVCSCKSNSMADAYRILHDYSPIYSLLSGDREMNRRFPVIGIVNETEQSLMAHTYSVRPDEFCIVERDANSAFCKIFAEKLEKILAAEDMDLLDRARAEELRDFFLDTLTRFFFKLRSMNFPRVLGLIAAVAEKAGSGSISEEDLNENAPNECKALLGNEAIMTKDSVDMSSVWYKVNSGIHAFAALCKRFNLMSGQKMALLDAVIK